MVQVVDFGEGGPVRCSRCKGYINPFMRFVDQGRKFTCNFCGKCFCFQLMQATQSEVIAGQLQLYVSSYIIIEYSELESLTGIFFHSPSWFKRSIL